MKKINTFLSCAIFLLAIGGAFASSKLLVYSGFRSPGLTGSPCFTFASIPDYCLTSNNGLQCIAIVGGNINRLWASRTADDTQCLNPVRLP